MKRRRQRTLAQNMAVSQLTHDEIVSVLMALLMDDETCGTRVYVVLLDVSECESMCE